MQTLLAWLGGALCVGLTIEIALRIYYRVPLAPRCFQSTSDRETCRFRPNSKCVYYARGRTATLTIDADGGRLVPGCPREAKRGAVYVLGDSQAFGWGLSDDESLPYFLQQALGADWQVKNWAIPRAGPHTYFELLERIPRDATVLVLHSEDSDLVESRADRPPIHVRCGLMLPDNWHGKYMPCWLTYSYFFQAAVRLRRSYPAPRFPLPINFHPERKALAEQLAQALTDRYLPHREQRGRRLLFSVIPWEAVIVPRRNARYRPQLAKAKRYAAMPEDVDLYETFLQYPNGDALYQSDLHLSAAGSRLAAERLATSIRALADV